MDAKTPAKSVEELSGEFEASVNSTLEKEGVRAAIVADKYGLAVAAKSSSLDNETMKKIAAASKELLDAASLLPAVKGEFPTIALETSNNLLLMSRQDTYSTTTVKRQ
jgi:hypothetical protein